MSEFLKKIAACCYEAGVRLRHFLFDTGLLKSETFDIPIICVGNITVGGTGKTPTVEMIVGHMYRTRKVALLSRGYGRRTHGYREVAVTDSYRDVGDEPLQMKLKYPDAVVVVCEKRVKGIRRIRAEHPEVDLIVMDDGFQHRYVSAKVNVVVVDATRPVEQDHMLPYGSLRDIRSSLERAHYFIVSKCSDSMSPLDRMLMKKVLLSIAYQKIYFMRYESLPMRPVFADVVGSEAGIPNFSEVIAMSGVGNPSVFIRGLRLHYRVIGELTFDDHHVYRVRDMHAMERMLAEHPNAYIVTTEKDAVKIFNSRKISDALKRRLYYIPVRMSYIEESDKDFLQNLEKDVG
ncbi:MAG: tetraacyldisaccharide 4'-kinase [Alistipes sp.]|nr:tetraacyldisaccharide 4'-kinase [Alistipes sp.]